MNLIKFTFLVITLLSGLSACYTTSIKTYQIDGYRISLMHPDRVKLSLHFVSVDKVGGKWQLSCLAGPEFSTDRNRHIFWVRYRYKIIGPYLPLEQLREQDDPQKVQEFLISTGIMSEIGKCNLPRFSESLHYWYLTELYEIRNRIKAEFQ